MSYAYTKLRLAMHCLIQDGTPRDRLAKAIGDHLICLRPKDLPFEVRKDFSNLIDEVCRDKAVHQQTSVRQLLDSLPDTVIWDMNKTVLRMYGIAVQHKDLLSVEPS